MPPVAVCSPIQPALPDFEQVEFDMNEILFVVEEAEDGSYRAQAVGASIHTEAETLEELPELIRDAVHCHFEEGKAPPLIRLHHVREELLTLGRSRGISTGVILRACWPATGIR
jgi:hypothetical protein